VCTDQHPHSCHTGPSTTPTAALLLPPTTMLRSMAPPPVKLMLSCRTKFVVDAVVERCSRRGWVACPHHLLFNRVCAHPVVLTIRCGSSTKEQLGYVVLFGGPTTVELRCTLSGGVFCDVFRRAGQGSSSF